MSSAKTLARLLKGADRFHASDSYPESAGKPFFQHEDHQGDGAEERKPRQSFLASSRSSDRHAHWTSKRREQCQAIMCKPPST